jgi:hypothetical protein
MEQAKRLCGYCGAEFEPVRSWQRFCGTSCRLKSWESEHPRVQIGKPFTLVRGNPGSQRRDGKRA